MNATDQGLHFFTQAAQARGAAQTQNATGWTSPTDIYREMSDLDAQTKKLDALIQANVQDAPFKTGWAAWLASWREFYGLYDSGWSTGRLGAVFHTDQLKAQTDAYWSQYASWEKNYQTRTGQLVPSPVAPTPPAPAPEPPGSSWTLPWWGWVGLTVGVIGGGVFLYYKAKELMAKRKVLDERIMPAVLGRSFGPELGPRLAEASAARDPLSLAHYAAEHPAQEVMYRPMQHPHVLPVDAFAYPARQYVPSEAPAWSRRDAMPRAPRDGFEASDLYEIDE